MLDYCVQDVKVNTRIFNNLINVSKDFSKECMRLEHDVAPIIKEQEQNGFKFDMVNATMLLARLRERMTEIETEVKKVFKPRMLDVKLVVPVFKKDGTLSKRGLRPSEYEKILNTNDYEPFYRKELQEFNLGSRKQIGEYLVDFGWKPKKFTPTGQPIVDELTLYEVEGIPEAKLIAEYLLVQKRLAQIESWVDAVEDDGRVHGFVIPNGTITGRMTHRNPNMAQVPSIHSPYGQECRACWVVEDEYKLVGVDASQLELRLLSHYMNDEEYIKNVSTGDIHATNQALAGLESRDQAKTFIYAFVYGAGDSKLGSIIGGNTKDGQRLRKNFLDNIPALKNLRFKVTRAAAKGWIKGLDGRKLFIRSEHGALNTLLQSAGAIYMKKALILLNERLKLSGMDFKFVANIHDEWQIEVRACQATKAGALAVEAMVKAGEELGIRCPMTGEYKIGNNWSETH
jgi:DNA polymerase-1